MDTPQPTLEVLSNIQMDIENKNNKNNKYIDSESAFYFNHIWMFITVIITLLTAIVLKIPLHRYIILMETFISAVSATIYYFLHKKIQLNKKNNEDVDWKGITVLRYNGWMFTTPVMLIAFLLFLSSSTKIKVTLPTIVVIVLLDWVMLYLGYLGEIESLPRNTALVSGFIPLLIIFGIIYQTFFKSKFILFNYIVFALFVLFWSLYGIGYMWELEPRNYLMNVLDLLSKSGFGLLFAFYFLYKR